MQEATRREIKRLTGSERGALATAYGDLRVALVYPNSYRLGMSNLGFQTLYGLINRNPIARCERSFLLDAEEAVALESGLTLSSFDVLAFSISFELDYPNIVEILRRARIPPRSKDRKETHPLILAGGAAMMLNPEPVADFMDAVVIGEAEPVLDGILSTITAERRKSKLVLFEKLAQLEGVYIPSLYQAGSDEQGRLQGIKPLGGAPFRVRRNSPPDIETFDTTTEILTPHTVFGRTFLVEVSRGCPRKCKFCAGTKVYCPSRYRSADRVIASVEQRAPNQRRVGLLGAAVGDHPQMEHICSTLVEQGRNISISSLHPGRVSPELAGVLSKGGVKTLTVAPEAGSEELRRKVGKPLSNEELTDCARIVKEAGIQSLKLYFMVGLPGEARQDVDEIVARVAELASIIRVKVSVSPFVPKARTPYQRIGAKSLDYLRNTISDLQKATRRMPGVTFSAGSPRHSLIEAALSRGNRSASRWLEAGTISARELEHLACRSIPEDETLPWDHLQDALQAQLP